MARTPRGKERRSKVRDATDVRKLYHLLLERGRENLTVKRFIHISMPSRMPQNERVFVALLECARSTGLPHEHILELKFEERDPRVQRVLAILHAHGFTMLPPNFARLMSSEESLMHVRHRFTFEFEQSDWESAEYLTPKPTLRFHGVDDLCETNEGVLQSAFPDKVPQDWRSVDIAVGLFTRYVISDRVRSAFQPAGLRHVRLKPVMRSDHDQSKGVPMLWELGSDLILPPMSLSVPFRDAHGLACDRDDPRPVVREPDPVDGMWAYERRSINLVGPFDVARTAEPNLGPNGPLRQYTPLIVSAAFYRIFRDNHFSCSWTPVKIVED